MAAVVDPTAVAKLLKKTQGAPAPSTDQQLTDAYDADVQAYRAQPLGDPSRPMSTSDIAARGSQIFNDMRQDAATGPQGYNRQWVPLLQSLKGKRFLGGGSLPTERYADPTGSGEMTVQPQTPYDVSTPTVTMPTVTMPTRGPAPMPQSFEDFTTQLYATRGQPGADVTPTTTLQRRATKGPVGRHATPDAITASQTPPGQVFSLDVLRKLAGGA